MHRVRTVHDTLSGLLREYLCAAMIGHAFRRMVNARTNVRTHMQEHAAVKSHMLLCFVVAGLETFECTQCGQVQGPTKFCMKCGAKILPKQMAVCPPCCVPVHRYEGAVVGSAFSEKPGHNVFVHELNRKRESLEETPAMCSYWPSCDCEPDSARALAGALLVIVGLRSVPAHGMDSGGILFRHLLRSPLRNMSALRAGKSNHLLPSV